MSLPPGIPYPSCCLEAKHVYRCQHWPALHLTTKQDTLKRIVPCSLFFWTWLAALANIIQDGGAKSTVWYGLTWSNVSTLTWQGFLQGWCSTEALRGFQQRTKSNTLVRIQFVFYSQQHSLWVSISPKTRFRLLIPKHSVGSSNGPNPTLSSEFNSSFILPAQARF